MASVVSPTARPRRATASSTSLVILLTLPQVERFHPGLFLCKLRKRSLSVTLKGRLVDDNRATLTTASMDKIRQQLKDIHLAMNARDIAPGSARALRLFS